MKFITYSERSVMVGDEVADLLMTYAKLLARTNSADTVDLTTITPNGVEVTATLLVGPATIMMAESSNSTLPEPENSVAVEYLTAQIDLIENPPGPLQLPPDQTGSYSDDDIGYRFD